jgi:hypothetical protein
MRTIDVAKEKGLIEDTWAWPNYPLLPVKNYKMAAPGSFPECGIIFASEVEKKGKVVVYMTNLFMVHKDMKLEELQKFEYESLQAMVEAGWIGD